MDNPIIDWNRGVMKFRSISGLTDFAEVRYKNARAWRFILRQPADKGTFLLSLDQTTRGKRCECHTRRLQRSHPEFVPDSNLHPVTASSHQDCRGRNWPSSGWHPENSPLSDPRPETAPPVNR